MKGTTLDRWHFFDEEHQEPKIFGPSKICFWIGKNILLFAKFIFEWQKSKELPSRTVLKNKIQFLVILKTLLKFNKEGMIKFWQYVFLSHDVLLLILLQDILLLKDLHGVYLLVFLTPHQQDLRVGSLPYDWQSIVIIKSVCLHYYNIFYIKKKRNCVSYYLYEKHHWNHYNWLFEVFIWSYWPNYEDCR